MPGTIWTPSEAFDGRRQDPGRLGKGTPPHPEHLPADWVALASAEAKRNPRFRESLGRPDLVPAARRVSGPGASLVMAPFVHCSDAPSDARAASPTVHTVSTPPATRSRSPSPRRSIITARPWPPQMKNRDGLPNFGNSSARSIDASHDPALLDPDDHAPSWTFGAKRQAAGSEGFHRPSVRYPGGSCVGVLWPDAVTIPIQGWHFAYRWNGEEVDYVKRLDGSANEVWRVAS